MLKRLENRSVGFQLSNQREELEMHLAEKSFLILVVVLCSSPYEAASAKLGNKNIVTFDYKLRGKQICLCVRSLYFVTL
jgi:hypothetical protein